ncbi:hypothetical protein PVAND_000641 [Polypedilum vanderplanki]|uniref:Chitin-binding type-2 domain-containing protein n=1 Tax=Polypedilum vanderplanki TaxID=319348 RepID=A0A9J6BKS6_POLVA|nr:hypothetical protein PVAND_000641 [Polypedilum vanderplanki]
MKKILIILIFYFPMIFCQVPTAPTVTPTFPTAPIVTTEGPTEPTIPTAPPSNPVCPPSGVAHLPDSRCQYFVVCINGVAHEGRCVNGQLWDTTQNVCREAHLVDCGTRT